MAFEEQFESKSKPVHQDSGIAGPVVSHAKQSGSDQGKPQGATSQTSSSDGDSNTATSSESTVKLVGTSTGDSGTDSTPLWVLDPKESVVSLVVLKATGEHEVAFKDFSASLKIKNDVPEKLSISVRTASLDTPVVAFREHLKSATFLDVKSFPEATFETREIRAVGSKKTSFRVRGKLVLRGHEKEIQFLARVKQSSKEFSGTARVKIDAKHFGIHYPELANELVQEIFLSLKLKFSRALA